ncbi:related to YIM1 Mitochondrial inner membrane protease [Rhynchosporium agropyri]|uniref:Related to YIM1 Mitochondrial inner membrane protease n=1 Tax=Rhynchosporium agropyri TaxID=914238 RepID=A0A1E1LRV8_9HELO|nr:related to YIM1 Mitochondrial inner membrane protease [Rhynchosporium agropyri]
MYPQVNKCLRFQGTPGSDPAIVEKDILPLPGNEILVKVHAASINPCDIQLWRSGLVGVVSGDKGMGKDFSGTVVAVGEKVSGWADGDEIFGLFFHVFGQSTFSEYINVNPASDPVAKKPGSLTHEQAAAIPLVALTAYACLEWLPAASGSQRKVVIRGASGGTGSWLVQLAKIVFDYHVTAICSEKNLSYVKSLGADTTIDYTAQDVSQSLLSNLKDESRYDLVVDCVGGKELIPVYEQLLHTRGAYLSIVGDKTDVFTLGGPITYFTNPIQIIRYIKGYIWGPRYACVSFVEKSEYLQQIASLAERGELAKVDIEVLEGIFDEREAWRTAIERMLSMRVRGKVVLSIP